VFHRFHVHRVRASDRIDFWPSSGEILGPDTTLAGVWRVDIRTGREEQLVPAGVQPRFSPDGREVMFLRPRAAVEFNRDDPWIYSLDVLSLRTGRSRTIGPKGSYAADWSPDGKRICYLRSLTNPAKQDGPLSGFRLGIR
jgi:Tol biopolymer transport system component